MMLPFSVAYGVTVPTIDEMFQKLSENMTPVIILTSAVSYVIGFVFIASALLELKKIGESHGAAGGISGPLIKMITAVALIFLPSIVETGRYTLWGVGHDDPIFAYTGVSDQTWDTVLKSSVLIVKAIGYISVIRGFTMLSRVHQHGGQSGSTGSTGKAVIYITSGILAINIVATTRVVAASLGFVLS